MGAKVKFCGLFRDEDAAYANEVRPDFGGLVFHPGSHRYVDDATACRLRGLIDAEIPLVGVFVDDTLPHIRSLVGSGTIQVVQLHGHETEAQIALLRRELPGVPVWKAFKVRDAKDLEAARSSSADRVLLDNGQGTGMCFDWSLAEGFPSEFVLAGGLSVGNLADAIGRFDPWAVDMSSGIETDGVKDLDKMRAVIGLVRGGGRTCGRGIGSPGRVR
jgi:phosphoribosylanthranilate isomerase